MTSDERKPAPPTADEAPAARRVNRATIALLALLVVTGLARRFGLLDPILTYGVGGGLAFCLLIVQLDRLHTRGQQRDRSHRRAQGDEDPQI